MAAPDAINGLLLVDKPAGPTSRDISEAMGRCFARPRRRRGDGSRFRVGHAGTLDPLATGLLLVLVGRGTRLQPFLQKLDKRYTAVVRLGVATDSLDADGEVTAHAPVPADPGDLAALAARFTGEIMQAPPVISAIKRGGRSLHELARKGAEPAPPEPRPVILHALSITTGRWGEPATAAEPGHLPPDGRLFELVLDVHCGAGTYIRSLARDLAAALGTVGHIQALRRTAVGPFDVDQAVHADASGEELRTALRPLAAALPHVPAITLPEDLSQRLRQGVQPTDAWFAGPVPSLFRLLDPAGELAGVGRRDPVTGQPSIAIVLPASCAAGAKDDPCA
jgi:tRNA pseudouridine55 synthase